jgi:hypothetical protein
MNPELTKNDFRHLLEDQTPCYEIDTSGSATEHELGELARLDGHASLTSCLNEWNAWGRTVSQVADLIINTESGEE